MTDRFNTIAGWTLFAAIVALGLSILSDMYFHGDKPERPETMGYPIAGVVEESADEGPSLAALLATGDPAAGASVFAKCTACHTIEQGGANGIGPNLYGVLGVPIGKHVAGFAYSSDLANHGGEWTYENMDAWLASPRGFAPGTKMTFAGLSNPVDRANLILYMREEGGGGPPLPEPPAEAEGEGEATADAPDEGPGSVEGAPLDAVEAAGAMGSPQPVPGEDQTNPVD